MNQQIHLMDKAVKYGRYAAIAERLRSVRDVYGFSAKDFAERAGIDPKRYYNWENGKDRISIDGASQLKREYGLSLDFIYDGNVDMLPHKIAVALSSKPAQRA